MHTTLKKRDFDVNQRQNINFTYNSAKTDNSWYVRCIIKSIRIANEIEPGRPPPSGACPMKPALIGCGCCRPSSGCGDIFMLFAKILPPFLTLSQNEVFKY